MRIIRSYQLIKSLSNKELSKFKLFLSSPYHNQQSELLKLASILIKVPYKKVKNKELPFTDLKLYKKLYGSESPGSDAYCRKKIRNVISDLTLKLEYFIAIESLKKDKMKTLHYVNDFLSYRGLQKATVISRNKWKRQIQKEPDTIGKYINRYYCHVLEFESLHNDRLKPETSEPFLKGMISQATNVYWYAQLSYLCHHLFRSPIVEKSKDLTLQIQLALAGSKNFDGQDDQFPSINMYRKLLKLGQNLGEMPSYLSCKHYLETHILRIAVREASVLLQFLLSYCQSSFNQGNPPFMSECFQLIAWGLTKGIISESEMSSDAFFINYAVGLIALHHSETDIDAYLEDYTPYIPDQYQQDALNMVNAYRCFHRQQLETALEYLREIEPRNHYYKVRIHSVQIRIFYHLFTRNTFKPKALRAYLATYQKFFKSDKLPLSQQRKDSYLQLAWFIKEMIRCRTQSHRDHAEHLNRLAQELHTRPLPFRDWVELELQKLTPV